MNLTSFWRLTWKEYRAARGFWLAMIALVVFLQFLMVAIPTSPDIGMIFGLALGAPAFFALGCCGAAFAVEREEGTFDFLRAAPVAPWAVLGSKLLLAASATAAMFAVLWPLAMVICGMRLGGGDWLPHGNSLRLMLGLWPLAAVEAIAWSTFFSLRGSRPLVAVCLAMLAATTTTHLLAWSVTPPPFHAFELAPYLLAVPRRAIVALVVLAVDVYLGLRWLDRGETGARRTLLPSSPEREASGMWERHVENVTLSRLLATPDRGGMLGHLFWQQWRQSRWLMGLMTPAFLLLGFSTWTAAMPKSSAIVLVGVVPALMGAMVFLPDQERRRFRFFVEHNVPPRWVWVSRQLPWGVLLAIAAVVVCVCAVGPFNLVLSTVALWASDPYLRQLFPDVNQFYLYSPPILLGVSIVAVSDAAGQWASMMVKSGIMAGFFAVLLAGVLSGWVILMDGLGVSYWWSVAPIPLVLVWATWLRAPDWIAENTTWHARARAAAAVLVPALVLCVAVPLYRVYSVPWVSPGFEPAKYLSSDVTSQAKATGELYRRANELLGDSATKNANSSHPIVSADGTIRYKSLVGREFLDDNTEALNLILEAAARPECAFDDPRTATDQPIVGNEIIRLVIASGQLLQADGKLDEAFERYLTALKVVCDLTDHNGDMSLGGMRVGNSVGQYRLEGLRQVFDEISGCARHQGQTPERLRRAIGKLQAVDNTIFPLDDRLKSTYIVAARYVSGDATAWGALPHGDQGLPPAMLWPKLMPWEKYRGQRVLNEITAIGLQRLDLMRKELAQGLGVADSLPIVPARFSGVYTSAVSLIDAMFEENFVRQRQPDWLPSITPDLWSTGRLGRDAGRGLAEFEARRRGTLLVLALEAYRIEHGELPQSLDELVGAYFDELPVDPYSGNEFCYYRDGFPAAATRHEATELMGYLLNRITAGEPCVWCTGPELSTVPRAGLVLWSNGRRTRLKCSDVDYYTLRGANPYREVRPLPSHVAWSWGFVFPLH